MNEMDGNGITERTVYEMKVIQSDRENGIRGKPYRVIGVPSDLTLYSFAEAINDCFDFDFDHCFGFYNDLKNYYRSSEGYELFADLGEESEFNGVKKTRMRDVFKEMKKDWLFYFDYGDGWHFIIRKVGERVYENGLKYPLLLNSEGDALPQYPDFDDDDGDD